MRRIGGSEIERCVLIDGNNLLQRAYYVFIDGRMKGGLPLKSGPDGYSTGIIYGFISFLNSWLYDMKPYTSISVFFDGKSTRRRTMDPTYKVHREENKNYDFRIGKSDFPVDLFDGFKAESDLSALVHIIKLLGCNVYHDPNEEADDLIASFCKHKPETIRIIVSDDKDFFQLMTDPRIITYRPGSKTRKFCDAAAAEEVWGRLNKVKGVGTHPKVPCSQVRMFKTFCGDSSDGITGIPSLRKKIAMTICHLPTLDDVYATDFPSFSKLERTRALELKDRIKLNWELVGLKDDLDLSQSLQPAQKNYQMAVDICRYLGMDDLDFGSFRPVKNNVVESIPLDSWLADI